MARFNAALRGDLQRALNDGRRQIVAITKDITGANTEPVRKAASALATAWRKVLSVKAPGIRVSLKTKRARGQPSAPGQPPHQVAGFLRKSIRTGVVDGVRRVGTASFVARLLETGVSSGGGAPVLKRRTRKGVSRRDIAITIAARPHAKPALDAAAPKMTDVLVSEAQRRIATGSA